MVQLYTAFRNILGVKPSENRYLILFVGECHPYDISKSKGKVSGEDCNWKNEYIEKFGES